MSFPSPVHGGRSSMFFAATVVQSPWLRDRAQESAHCGPARPAMASGLRPSVAQLQNPPVFHGPGRPGHPLHPVPRYSRAGCRYRRLSRSPVASSHHLREQIVECTRTGFEATIGRRVALVVQLLAVSSSSAIPVLAETISQGPPAGYAILRSLGIGDPDIFYPRFFEGTWDCLSTLLSVDTPQGEDKADIRSVNFSRKQIGFTVAYKARFVPYESNIIGDRLFTTKSLVESTMGHNIVSNCSWSPQQPNRLTLELNSGIKVENLVTKRSAGMSAPGQFDTSEYSKQVFDYRRGGPPSVKASRNLTRYRWDATSQEVNSIEAVQRVAMYPVPGSEIDMTDVFGMANPVAIYRYVVQFTRS